MAFAAPTTPINPCSFFLQRREKLTCTTTTTTSRNLVSPSPCSKEFIPKAASSSGAEYSDQLLGAKPRPKRRKIAGIDQDELLEPELLADPDSCFCEFEGLKIHYKVCDAESDGQNLLPDGTSSQMPYQMKKIEFPIFLLHGFGASVFSWTRVMKPLAQLTCSKVLAFDRPAFGLTSRVNFSEKLSLGGEDTKPLNPYSIIFSVLTTLYFIDSLTAEKAILVGHSAGANVAVEAYFEAPDRIAALILVSPAIIAPPFRQMVVKENHFGVDKQSQRNASNSNVHENPVIRFCRILSKLYRYIAQAISRLVKRVVGMLNSLYKKALSAFLRSAIAVMLIRIIIDKFGINSIRNAWYDSKQITDQYLHGYTKPLRAKNWDKALVEFTAAMITDSVSESKPATAKRLNEISCPVLIVTGDSDRLVPSWNAKRLSKAIPGSCVEVIKNCGHMPHEEKVEEFMSIVANFLHKAFGGLQEQRLEAEAAAAAT